MAFSQSILVTGPIETSKFEQVIQMIAPQSSLLRTWSLKGGISAKMTALEIEYPDGKTTRMILRQPSEQTFKRNPHAAEYEFKTLQLTQSLGLVTPAPYYLDQSCTIFSKPYVVIEYIDGKPEFAPASEANFIFQFAEHLARIHSADYSNYNPSFLPRQGSECVELSREPPANIDLVPDDRRIRDRLDAVVPLPQRNASVLLHGDYWPGNILWRDDLLVAVIDWEDAAIGDPLIDFAISRLDILTIFGIEAMQSDENSLINF